MLTCARTCSAKDAGGSATPDALFVRVETLFSPSDDVFSVHPGGHRASGQDRHGHDRSLPEDHGASHADGAGDSIRRGPSIGDRRNTDRRAIQ